MSNNINKSKKIVKLVVILIVIISCMVMVPYISGCSVYRIIKESYIGEEESLELPETEIDEAEIKEIGKGDIDIKKSYDIEGEINLVDESARDPFKPFYLQDEEEEEKNVLKLESIYTKDGIEYAEISLNDYPYKLKEGDPLSDSYLVQVINSNSVVLLKGDDILNIFMDEIIYD
ncbi:MAG: hypothetical protein A2163_08910 [Actinobacteria bacterium RBG_13_35_12]|nr:MAG: hypothetical protein A2163_08910 [Actinobacteria bacterium RBG_13_35_12]